MENSVATIQCPNPTCQASNPLTDESCQKCGAHIPRRYLRAMGDWFKVYHLGELLENRYLIKNKDFRVVLDTKPGLHPEAPDEMPARLLYYLKLFPYRLHIPHIYSYIPPSDPELNLDIWFLEYSNLPLDSSGELRHPEFFPQLNEVWTDATPLRQLNWLWQMAHLWQPLQSKGAVSSLLNPSFLRVNGGIFQLLELQQDPNQVPSLKQLGKLWAQWTGNASPLIQDFLQQLCDHLEQGKIKHSEQLIATLDYGLRQAGRAQQRTYQLFTCTDAGPTRDHNEDSRYPTGSEILSFTDTENPLAIVCDGIGGQEGGEIASQLAIETLAERLNNQKVNLDSWNPIEQEQAIGQALCDTNDVISQRNDREKRRERERMGTTIVMSQANAHEMYLAHVGDSRIYLITPTSCQQLTVDDDLASREVRMGYLLYRDAIQYPNAGALVQALGMSPANTLRSNVQRLILDEDCLFLLCSDGLSDYDRVEEYWESEIVPVLKGEKNVAEVAKQLVELANRVNGHDNVTVALVYCQVTPRAEGEQSPVSFPVIEISSTIPSGATDKETINSLSQTVAESDSPTSAGEPVKSSRKLPLFVALISLLGLVAIGGGIYWFSEQNRNSPPTTDPSPELSPSSNEENHNQRNIPNSTN
jgi:protein phosphatase